MSQATLVVPDSNGATFLTNLNAAIQASATNQSGNTAPATAYPFQFWVDTSLVVPTLKLRNAGNSAHVNLGLRMDVQNFGLPDPFGWDPGTTSALNYGYKTGVVLNSSQVPTIVAAGTVALTNAATNYIERTTDGTVSANTAGFTAGRVPMATAVTAGSVVTTVTEYRVSALPASALLIHRECVGYWETAAATTDKQPAIRFPVPRKLAFVHYYKDNATALVGNTVIELRKNGTSVCTITLTASAVGTTVTDCNGGTGATCSVNPNTISFAAGDVLTWTVTSIGGTPPSNLSLIADFTENPR